MTIDVQLQKDSVVNKRTGEVESPTEYVENLRAIESLIAHADAEIAALQGDLKAARSAREKAVGHLRQAVREGTVLPLLEMLEKDDDEADEPADDAL